MPLYKDAIYLIRANLEQVARGGRVQPVPIGCLTRDQHRAINALKESDGLPTLDDPEVLFLGQHLYKSRVMKDGYTIDDVIKQITSALAETSIAIATPKMTAIKSTTRRSDGYGNDVLDEAVFELSARKPKAELFSVVPKGDRNKPNRQKK